MSDNGWTPERIAELRHKAASASPLPYVAQNHPDFQDDQDWIIWSRDAAQGEDFIANADSGPAVVFDLMAHNAAFVEAACNSVLSLLDALESARAERDAARAHADQLEGEMEAYLNETHPQ